MSRILRRPMFRGGRVDSRGTGITSGLSYNNGGRVGYFNGGTLTDPEAIRKARELGILMTPKYLDEKFRKKYYLDEEVEYVPDPASLGMQGMVSDTYGLGIEGNPVIDAGGTLDTTRDLILTGDKRGTPAEYEQFFKEKFITDNYKTELDKQKQILEAAGDERLSQLTDDTKVPEKGETREQFEARIRREAAEELQALLKAETEKDPAEIIKKNKKIFQEAYGSGRGEDATNMLLSFAGKALKPGADTKSAFGEFFEEESKRPSESKKYKDAATTAAINAYLTGEKSIADFEKALKLNRAKISDQISMTRGIKDWQDYLKEGTGTGDKKTSMGSMIYAVEKMNEAGKIDAAWGGPLPDDPSQYQEGLIYVQENPNGGKLLVEWDGEKLFTHTPVYK